MRCLLILPFLCLAALGTADDDFYWPEPNPPYTEPEPFTKPVKTDKELEKPSEVQESEDMKRLEEGDVKEEDPSFPSGLQEDPIPDNPIPNQLKEEPIPNNPLPDNPIPDKSITQAKKKTLLKSRSSTPARR